MASERLPSPLVETTWLAERLNEPNIRVIDSTVFFQPSPSGGVSIESGRRAWEGGHIPGSAFADLIETFSPPSPALLFTLPSAERFAAGIEGLGISEDVCVIVYDQGYTTWATRFWWLLRTFGFDHAAVLNGGWKKWTLENLPISTETSPFACGHFAPKPRPELIATKDEVLAAMNDGGTCLINTLSPGQHAGRIPVVSNGRRGHIPSSVNVPAGALVDPTTNAYLPLEHLQAKLAQVGATTANKVITYCAAGIDATSDAFILTLLGVPDVTVYNGGLVEWSADPDLPLETGTD
ncbi:MAG: sulfurtransferase [Ktedonobacteraceae bacterium]|jgi:thiosulfate/3-mercaptopyruvate sulfurtransferase|nr:MAG: hypothetical protein AUG51_17240 [Acidobacteria bacterium 13_1_20CM_3_53_8]